MKSLILALAVLATSATALAIPTPLLSVDTPPCDPLFIPQLVDELGFAPPFPIDEHIEAVATTTNMPACPPMDDPLMPNAMVVMTNFTVPPRAFSDVWYVKDIETSFTNVDGMAAAPGLPPQDAFKIDAIGINTPLVSESLAADGIFSPGETWTFIIQDYANTLGLPASLYDSIGVPSTLSPPSSGSIVALEVPEPGAMAILALCGLAGLVRGRR